MDLGNTSKAQLTVADTDHVALLQLRLNDFLVVQPGTVGAAQILHVPTARLRVHADEAVHPRNALVRKEYVVCGAAADDRAAFRIQRERFVFFGALGVFEAILHRQRTEKRRCLLRVGRGF